MNGGAKASEAEPAHEVSPRALSGARTGTHGYES